MDENDVERLPRDPDAVLDAAVQNNATWCDAVCRAHGLAPAAIRDAWTCPIRTPELYPDAVTLDRRPDVDALLSGVDDGPGCSVKDSYASIDLEPHGFDVLFEATWIGLEAMAAPSSDRTGGWQRATTAAELAGWEAAWVARGDGVPGTFPPALADDPRLAFVGGEEGGAALFRANAVAGVSNVFGDGLGLALAAAEDLFPLHPVVGYESGDRLAEAQERGFQLLGTLRVWVRHR